LNTAGNLEKTFAILKPDTLQSKNAGHVLARIESEGFRIVALKKHDITESEAKAFYAEHSERGFFSSLVAYMTSGPVIVAVLEREGAVAHWRSVMGATDPAKAEAGTIRKQFGESIERNAVHGSAVPVDAAREVVFFFSTAELLS
jgi:nucleoside-diphosphate kinase